jgi:hypothetical protein
MGASRVLQARIHGRFGAARGGTGLAGIQDVQFDHAIRHIVETLREEGVETFESCQGGPGHAFAEPTVRFHGGREEGFRALACAIRQGLPVAELRRYWQVVDGEPRGPHWEMTFYAVGRATTALKPAAQTGLRAAAPAQAR